MYSALHTEFNSSRRHNCTESVYVCIHTHVLNDRLQYTTIHTDSTTKHNRVTTARLFKATAIIHTQTDGVSANLMLGIIKRCVHIATLMRIKHECSRVFIKVSTDTSIFVRQFETVCSHFFHDQLKFSTITVCTNLIFVNF